MSNAIQTKYDFQDFLNSLTDYRPEPLQAAEPVAIPNNRISSSDLVLYRINEITFEKDAPRQEALENVLSSLRTTGLNFIYLLLGDENGVNLYFGLSQELAVRENVNVQNIGDSILKSSLEGNFRGSSLEKVSEEKKRQIIEQIANGSNDGMKFATLEGVPGVAKKDMEEETFQGVDRLVDIMLGDRFGFMVIAHPICEASDIRIMEKNLYTIYEMLAPPGKAKYPKRHKYWLSGRQHPHERHIDL